MAALTIRLPDTTRDARCRRRSPRRSSEGSPAAYEHLAAEAAALAWERTLAFFDEHPPEPT